MFHPRLNSSFKNANPLHHQPELDESYATFSKCKQRGSLLSKKQQRRQIFRIKFLLSWLKPIQFVSLSFIFCSKQNKQNLEFFRLDSSEEVSLRIFNLAFSLEGFSSLLFIRYIRLLGFEWVKVGFAFKRKKDKETFAGAQIEIHLGISEALQSILIESF